MTSNLLLVLLTVISTSVLANGNGLKTIDKNADSKVVLMKGKEPGVLKLLYTDKTENLVRVKIYDPQNRLIHNHQIRNTRGFLRSYDLSQLEKGNYLFKIIDKTGSVTKQVQNYQLLEEQTAEVALRQLKDNKRYNLIVDADQASVKVKIFDESKNLIYAETIHSKNGFSKTYDLSHIRSKRFTFLISINNKTYKTFTI